MTSVTTPSRLWRESRDVIMRTRTLSLCIAVPLFGSAIYTSSSSGAVITNPKDFLYPL